MNYLGQQHLSPSHLASDVSVWSLWCEEVKVVSTVGIFDDRQVTLFLSRVGWLRKAPPDLRLPAHLVSPTAKQSSAPAMSSRSLSFSRTRVNHTICHMWDRLLGYSENEGYVVTSGNAQHDPHAYSTSVGHQTEIRNFLERASVSLVASQ